MSAERINISGITVKKVSRVGCPTRLASGGKRDGAALGKPLTRLEFNPIWREPQPPPSLEPPSRLGLLPVSHPHVPHRAKPHQRLYPAGFYFYGT